MNAVYNPEETTLTSALQTLIDQHGVVRVLGTVLTRAVRRGAKPSIIMASELSPHMRRDIGL